MLLSLKKKTLPLHLDCSVNSRQRINIITLLFVSNPSLGQGQASALCWNVLEGVNEPFPLKLRSYAAPTNRQQLCKSCNWSGTSIINGAFTLDYTEVSKMNFNEESSQSKKEVSLNWLYANFTLCIYLLRSTQCKFVFSHHSVLNFLDSLLCSCVMTVHTSKVLILFPGGPAIKDCMVFCFWGLPIYWFIILYSYLYVVLHLNEAC